MPGSTTFAPSFPTQREDSLFDLDGFFGAMRDRDANAWSDFFAPDAEWLIYRHRNPAVDPTCLDGNIEIHAFLQSVCASDVHLHVEDVATGGGSIWFRRMVRLADGRMVIEHVHLRVQRGLVIREIDVSAWDYA